MTSHFLTVAGAAEALQGLWSTCALHSRFTLWPTPIGAGYGHREQGAESITQGVIIFPALLRLLSLYLQYRLLSLDQKGVFADTWRMSADLNSLERKVDQLLDLCRKLRTENVDLRGRVVGLESEKLILKEKMDVARGRLESLMERLPEQ